MDQHQQDGMNQFLTIAGIMVGVFVFVASMMCLFQYRRNRNRKSMYSTPVVVTTVQTPNSQGQFPVQLQTGVVNTAQTHHAVQTNIPMPMPQTQNSFSAPYPPAMAPYPSTAPYPVNNTAPYPTTANYPLPNSQMNPPTYKQATINDASQKQPAYNPNFGG